MWQNLIFSDLLAEYCNSIKVCTSFCSDSAYEKSKPALSIFAYAISTFHSTELFYYFFSLLKLEKKNMFSLSAIPLCKAGGKEVCKTSHATFREKREARSAKLLYCFRTFNLVARRTCNIPASNGCM